MKKPAYLILLLACVACNTPKEPEETLIKTTFGCECSKEEIHQQFILKDYSIALTNFLKFKDCYKDQAVYNHKLGLLYLANEQKELGHETLLHTISLYEQDETLSLNEKLLRNAIIYLEMNDKVNLSKTFLEMDVKSLTRTQRRKVRSLKSFSNEDLGEFVAIKRAIDFQLFD